MGIPSSPENELISRLQNGEVKAFDTLFHTYSERLYQFAFSLLKNAEDSEGIIQESFLRVWDKRKDLDSTKSFRSYLFTISYNLIIDKLRKKYRERSYIEHLTKYFEEVSQPSELRVDYDIIKSQIDKAVEELPKKRRQIYRLSREEMLTHKEISVQLHISVKTVENQINLALKHLRNKVGTNLLIVLLYLHLFA